MSKKFIYLGTDGFREESEAFESTDFVSSSSGVSDAGKPVKLDASGVLDSSLIDESAIDHGSLGGLSDDDHTQYILADGSRDFSAAVSYSSHPSFSSDTELVDKKYVDDLVSGIEWQDSVLDRATAPAGGESGGERYLVISPATGDFAGQEDKIAEYNGSSFDFTSPTTGMFVSVDDETDGLYVYTGSSWTKKFFEATTASTGLTKVGVDIQIASSAAGDGLGFSSGVLAVNVDDSSIEIDTDSLRVKALGITNAMLAGSIEDSKLSEDYIKTSEVDDSSIEFSGGSLNVKADGINDTHIDFGTGTNQVSAEDLPIADAGGYTDETDVEGAIQELYTLVELNGVPYTAGAGGVSKGDLVYISGNDTVLPYSNIQVAQSCIGIAAAAAAAGNTVQILANDVVLDGFSGLTAGTRYYWSGTGWTSNFSSFSSGDYRYLGGIAKNASNVHVEVEFLGRES